MSNRLPIMNLQAEAKKQQAQIVESSSQQVKGQVPKGDMLEQNAQDVHVTGLEDLREKAPEVYEQMIKSLATNMIRQIGQFPDRLRRATRR